MSESTKTLAARRKTLKSALAGGTVAVTIPSSWLKPTVSSVILPGHAATTGGDGEPGGGTTVAPTTAAPTTAAPVCDPLLLESLAGEARVNLYNGGSNGFLFAEGSNVPTLTSFSISGGGGLTNSGAEADITESNSDGFETSFETIGFIGPVPTMATVTLDFADQPAPCVLNVPVNYIPE